MPVGNEDWSKTASYTDCILPVIVEMTIVAAVRLFPRTALEDARTVMSCVREESWVFGFASCSEEAEAEVACGAIFVVQGLLCFLS